MIRKFFEEISQIPRASFNEQAISDYLVDFGQKRGLRVIQDDKKNVIIFKGATTSYEDHPTVMLQSHIDMVAEKNQDSHHDFESDPIEVIEQDGWLVANKTTLGADDGAGVAYMLAILDDNNLSHPALECVFTVEEEVGMGGAISLDTSVLQAQKLIGLDSSGEKSVTISSSGGNRGEVTYPLKFEKTHKHQLVLKVRGLKGGHSGVEIDQERANAAKVVSDVIIHLTKQFNVAFSSIEGGLKDNAIMRECDVVLGFKEEEKHSLIQSVLEIEKNLQEMYVEGDPGLRIDYEVIDKDCYTISVDATKELAKLLSLLPYGYFQKSLVIKDLVIASANIGRIESNDHQVTIGLSMRAPHSFTLAQINQKVEIICSLCNSQVNFSSGYPGWVYEADSPLRDVITEVYSELHPGSEMELEATHGGLELGVWKEKMPQLDIAAIGPIMEDIHTPDERLLLSSFYRTYEHLVKVLERL